MGIFIAIGLTLALCLAIIKIVYLKQKKSISGVIGTQKDVHDITKIMGGNKAANKQKTSQMLNYERDHIMNIIIEDSYAYWVEDNTFYTAKVEDGHIDRSSRKPIDADSMDIKDVNRMLSILDSLKGGVQ